MTKLERLYVNKRDNSADQRQYRCKSAYRVAVGFSGHQFYSAVAYCCRAYRKAEYAKHKINVYQRVYIAGRSVYEIERRAESQLCEQAEIVRALGLGPGGHALAAQLGEGGVLVGGDPGDLVVLALLLQKHLKVKVIMPKL